MVMVKLTTGVDYVKWTEDLENVVLKCFYLETKKSEKYDSLNHYVEVAEGESKGNKLGLNGSANLDRALEKVPAGMYIEITYMGQVQLTGGKYKGKPCHQFEVACDPDRFHPLHGGGSAALNEVTYKNSDAPSDTKANAPGLVKPVSEAPAKEEAPAEVKAEEKPAETKQKPKRPF